MRTKIEALQNANWRCERCGIEKKDTPEQYLEIHHRLGISIALHNIPSIEHALLSSVANAQVLCRKCHKIQDQEDARRWRETYQEIKRSRRKSQDDELWKRT
jgi:protein-tyrosine-phosphatase